MRITSLSQLPSAPERAVVINVGTELVTTVAIASLRRATDMPVLVVDCNPTEGSRRVLDRLARIVDFDVLESPRMVHGELLDKIFTQTADELLFLVDSDAEVRQPLMVKEFRQALTNPSVFAAGFVRSGHWLEPEHGGGNHTGYYLERPWMPFVLFRVDAVRVALTAGASFAAKVIFNDFAFSNRISRLAAIRLQEQFTPGHRRLQELAQRRPMLQLQRLRNTRWDQLAWLRRSYDGIRPNYLYLDTGAQVYRQLKHQEGMLYAGSPIEVLGDPEAVLETEMFAHLHGITRLSLSADMAGGVSYTDEMRQGLVERLWDMYGLQWAKLVKS